LPPTNGITVLLCNWLFLLNLQLLVDNRLHVLRAAVIQLSTIYKNRWRSSDSQAEAFFVILPYPGCLDGALLVFNKFSLIQTELGPDFLNYLIIETIVIFKKFVVKFPEFALAAGCQSRHGSLNGIFMASNGKILENNSQICRVFFEQLLELRHKLCTIPSLKITEHDKHNPGSGRTQKGCIGNVNIKNKTDS